MFSFKFFIKYRENGIPVCVQTLGRLCYDIVKFTSVSLTSFSPHGEEDDPEFNVYDDPVGNFANGRPRNAPLIVEIKHYLAHLNGVHRETILMATVGKENFY